MASSYFCTAIAYTTVWCLVFVSAFFLFQGMARAQSTTTGTVNVRVIGPSHAVIPTVNVIFARVETGALRTAGIGSNAIYNFASLESSNCSESAFNLESRTTVWQADGAEAWASNTLNPTNFCNQEGGMAQ